MSAALKAIHAKRRQMGLDDDSYRALLVAVTGKTSSVAMDDKERRAVLTEMERRAAPRTASRRDRASGPYAGKLQALWIAAWNLGIVRDKSDAAMLSFVKRQTGLDHSRFLREPRDASRAIEALKDWMRRESRASGLFRYEKDLGLLCNDDRFQVLIAQWGRLAALDACPVGTLGEWIDKRTGGKVYGDFSGDDWIDLMNVLGRRLRQAKTETGS